MLCMLKNIIRRPAQLNVAGAVLAILTLGMVITGCVSARDSMLPLQLESRLAGNGNADDHQAAAVLYETEAQRLEAEALKYEQRAEALGRQLMDPKGFRRSGLLTLVGKNRKEAAELRELSAMHHTKALTMMGRQPSQ